MSRTILVVDDNELNLRLFSDLLRTQGYEILHAADGAQGLALAHAHRPGLIIMDLELPVMSGREAVSRIKGDAALRSIPIIAVSAFTTDEAREVLQGIGCDAYLEKPIRAALFLAAVHRFLDQAVA